MITFPRFFTALFLGLAAFLPTAAQAETNASVGAGVNVSVRATNPNTTTTPPGENRTMETRIDVSTGIIPMVITHESVQADLHADENAVFNRSTTTRGNATSSAAVLRAHASALVKSDPNISAVAVSESNVAVSYREPVKVFGFIKTRVPVRVSIDASGATKVRYPWYRFLLATDAASISVRAKAIASEHVSATTDASAQLSTGTALRLVDSLTAMLASEASADASVDAEVQ